jgi:hypothetical protein
VQDKLTQGQLATETIGVVCIACECQLMIVARCLAQNVGLLLGLHLLEALHLCRRCRGELLSVTAATPVLLGTPRA